MNQIEGSARPGRVSLGPGRPWHDPSWYYLAMPSWYTLVTPPWVHPPVHDGLDVDARVHGRVGIGRGALYLISRLLPAERIEFEANYLALAPI